METFTRAEWDVIGQRLQEPFDPAEVQFRPTGKGGANARAEVIAYIDARAVQQRLDDVVGPGNWSFDFAPLLVDAKGDIKTAKATLCIAGVSKSDVGEASNWSPSKGCVSDAEKRAAAQWGIARYLYDLDGTWVTLDAKGYISANDLTHLRAKLPKSGTADRASETQRERIRKGCQAVGQELPAHLATLTAAEADDKIAELAATYQRQQTEAKQPAKAAVPTPASAESAPPATVKPATEQQVAAIGKLCASLGESAPPDLATLNYLEAHDLIGRLTVRVKQARYDLARQPA